MLESERQAVYRERERKRKMFIWSAYDFFAINRFYATIYPGECPISVTNSFMKHSLSDEVYVYEFCKFEKVEKLS